MRHLGLMALPLALLVVPLSAQDFEGTVVLKLNGTQNLTWKVKGEKSLSTLSSVGGKSDLRYIVDRDAQTSTALMPLPSGFPVAQGVEGIKMVTDLRASSSPGGEVDTVEQITPRALGTSQTIAGLKCDDYELTDSLKTHVCLTKALGNFVFPARGLGGLGSPLVLGGNGGAAGAGFSPMRAMADSAMVSGRAMSFGDGNGGGRVMVLGGDGGAGGANGTVIISGTSGGTVGGSAVGGTSPGATAGGGTVNTVFATRATSGDGGTTKQVITMGPGGGTITTIDATGKSTTVPLPTDGSAPMGGMSGMSGMGGLPSMGGVQSMRPPVNSTPFWARAIKTSGFPLKVWIPGGRVILETSTVTRGPISDEEFLIPATYIDPAELINAVRSQGGAGGGR